MRVLLLRARFWLNMLGARRGSVIPEERLSILEQRMRELEERQRRDEELLRSRDRKLVAYQEALTHLVETVEKAKKKQP